MAILHYLGSDNKYHALPVGETITATEPESYSTEEQVIGQWIDGKPLYRKVVPFTYPAGSPYYEGDIKSIDVTDIENVWISDGWLDQGNDKSQLNNYYSSSCYCYTSVHKTDDKWYVYTRQAGFNNRNAVAIIEYTKTTDNPKSFSIDMLTTMDLDSKATAAEVAFCV